MYMRSKLSCPQHSCNAKHTSPPYPLFRADAHKIIVEV